MDETNTMDNQNYADFQQTRNADAVNPAPVKTATTAKRMRGVTAILFILVALIFDGIQAFLALILIGIVLNWIVSIVAGLIFYFWMKNLGVSMQEAKGMRIILSFLSAAGIEFIPLMNAFPAWTAFAILTVILEFTSKKA